MQTTLVISMSYYTIIFSYGTSYLKFSQISCTCTTVGMPLKIFSTLIPIYILRVSFYNNIYFSGKDDVWGFSCVYIRCTGTPRLVQPRSTVVPQEFENLIRSGVSNLYSEKIQNVLTVAPERGGRAGASPPPHPKKKKNPGVKPRSVPRKVWENLNTIKNKDEKPIWN